ncbi:MAG TPA: tripartite tricarboxylate transporter substrate binding protein, partial [Xanthobacteraceae bacterium]|nr:tripartite tricarboxylate transporter substrate binding protein [Xanthobacteraceae bacterium]
MICRRQRESIKLKAIVLGFAAIVIAGASFAQTSGYPNRPVKMIAPFAPGGPVDAVARVLAPKLSEGLGQQFYVENHPGGSGNIGTALAAKASPDGYTILVISSTLVVNPSLFAKLGFDTTSDLAPVSLVGVSPQVLLVHPSVPAASVKELVAWVKASPGQLSYAHAGLGTPGYLAGEMLKQAFGLDLVAVSFNGGGPAITSTIGGHTPILYTSISTAAGHIKQGTVRDLAVTGARRSPALPDVPTLAEAGAPGQESDIILDVLVPAETPQDVIDRLHHEIVRIVALPDVRERLSALGFEPIASTPKEFADRIRWEIDKWAK